MLASILIFLTIVLVPQTAAAQDIVPFPATFQHYSVEQGLSQSSVFTSLQDRYGFMWFGTQDGLNRFDGYTFRVYRAHLGDTTAIAGNSISGLYEGRTSGRLWVQTNNGLCLYNRAKETFTALKLPTSRINALLEDNRGAVWIATQQGVFRYLPSEQRVESCFGEAASSLARDSAGTIWIGTQHGLFFCKSPERAPILIQNHSAIQANDISTITTTRDALWIGTAQGLVELSSTTAKAITHHPESALPPELRTNTRIQEIRFDKTGCVWIRYANAVVRYHAPSGVLRSFSRYSDSRYPEAASKLRANSVSCICEDAHGRMWIGTTNGLYIFSHNRLKAVPVQSSQEFGLQEGLIRSLYSDRTGAMWIGLNVAGVQLWHRSRQKFTAIRRDELSSQTLVGASVRAFANGSKPHEYWVATESGLSYWAKETNTWKTYRADENNISQNSSATPRKASNDATSQLPTSQLPISQLRALYRAPNRILWIGTYGGGFVSFNPATERFTTYFYNPDDKRGIASEQVRVIFPDTARNLLFLGLYRSDIGAAPFNGGITVWQTQIAANTPFNPAQQQALRHYLSSPQSSSVSSSSVSSQNTLSSNEVRAFHRDAKGRLWIGTHGGGLNCLDERTGIIRHFLSNSKDSSALSGNTVTSICDADSGKLWVSTTFGLNKFDPERGTATRFTVRDGLANDFIYGMLPDKYGNLWLSTNHGLSRFSPSTRTFRNYDADDGLQSNEFNSGAYFLNAAGEMMFGGVNGFNIFHPDSVPQFSTQVTMRLTDFSTLNEPMRLDSALQEYRKLRLPYSQNAFSLEFSALEYSNIRKIRYAYKLAGVDKNWVFSGTRRFASYSELEPGTYQFYAQASNEDGSLDVEAAPMLIEIEIMPPFWKTWWFRLCALALVLGGAFGAYKARIRVIEHQKRELERLVQERTRELASANVELQSASEEIMRQNDILQEQTVQVELTNSELAEANAALEVMNTRLQTLNQRKNELVGMVAHDLRKPLTSIGISAQLITRAFDKMTPDKILEMIDKIKSSAERMNAIIGDVLNIEAVEAGTLQFRTETLNGSRLAANIVEEYTARAAQKNITLHYTSSAPDVMLFADERATSQVLENLISNAIKYSPSATNVWITVERVIEEKEGGEARRYGRFRVRDEGPGLSESDQEKLFGRFTRLTPRPTGGEPSTGLGLSIVKEFVEAMGGRVYCKSSLGAGSEFVVELPKREETFTEKD
jgi:signal transduction histidine kinase/ligand-binding sensor domain-containing protein